MKESFEYYINQRQNKPAEVIGELQVSCSNFRLVFSSLWQ
jgi:hypothetical protein